jgi:hypothetical protein
LPAVSPNLAEVLPAGVSLVRVEGVPDERRRILVARLAGRTPSTISVVIDALRGAYVG